MNTKANGEELAVSLTLLFEVYIKPSNLSKISISNESVCFVLKGFYISAILKLKSKDVKSSESNPPLTII